MKTLCVRVTRCAVLCAAVLASTAAFAAFEEAVRGSIETGKLADLTVFDKDLMVVPELEILRAKNLMTIINGEIVYGVVP